MRTRLGLVTAVGLALGSSFAPAASPTPSARPATSSLTFAAGRSYATGADPFEVAAGDLNGDRLDNWHHWRGPLANGTAPKADPPLNWDEKTNVKWKAELPGRGSATPIVWGDQVFVVTAVRTDRTAGADKLPKPDPRLEKRTQAPTNFHQFIVLKFSIRSTRTSASSAGASSPASGL